MNLSRKWTGGKSKASLRLRSTLLTVGGPDLFSEDRGILSQALAASVEEGAACGRGPATQLPVWKREERG